MSKKPKTSKKPAAKSVSLRYVITPIFAMMPDGTRRWVQTYVTKKGISARWNMPSSLFPKGKSLGGTVEQTATGWKFKFTKPEHRALYMNHYDIRRITFKDRSPDAVAERRYLSSIKNYEAIYAQFEH